MIATITPIVTTIQRKVEGLTRPANLPPKFPPINAPTAITSATGQITLPENKKKIAAAKLTLKEIACFKALSRVNVSSIVKPNTESTITLNPAPKYRHRSRPTQWEGSRSMVDSALIFFDLRGG